MIKLQLNLSHFISYIEKFKLFLFVLSCPAVTVQNKIVFREYCKWIIIHLALEIHLLLKPLVGRREWMSSCKYN